MRISRIISIVDHYREFLHLGALPPTLKGPDAYSEQCIEHIFKSISRVYGRFELVKLRQSYP